MSEFKVADEVWVALALLHQDYPLRGGFQSSEIFQRAQLLHPDVPCRRGVRAHISGHCVANRKPSPNRLRMLYRNADGTFRLFREGDDCHPERSRGRSMPVRDALPRQYWYLADWYIDDYTRVDSAVANGDSVSGDQQRLKVADEVWVATALLHRERPSREGFDAAEIVARAETMHAGEPCRAGVLPHIYSHCVANLEPASGRYRMLYRNTDGKYRLFRASDDYHPKREKGKVTPARDTLPREYRHLVDWYHSQDNEPEELTIENDPLMKLKGLGKELWQQLGGGDAVIAWLRSDTLIPPPWEKGPNNKADDDRLAD